VSFFQESIEAARVIAESYDEDGSYLDEDDDDYDEDDEDDEDEDDEDDEEY
jgi:hypothetical protein